MAEARGFASSAKREIRISLFDAFHKERGGSVWTKFEQFLSNTKPSTYLHRIYKRKNEPDISVRLKTNMLEIPFYEPIQFRYRRTLYYPKTSVFIVPIPIFVLPPFWFTMYWRGAERLHFVDRPIIIISHFLNHLSPSLLINTHIIPREQRA